MCSISSIILIEHLQPNMANCSEARTYWTTVWACIRLYYTVLNDHTVYYPVISRYFFKIINEKDCLLNTSSRIFWICGYFLGIQGIFQFNWSWFSLSKLSKFYPYSDLLISLEKIYDRPHPNPKNAIFLINLKWLIGSVSHILG